MGPRGVRQVAGALGNPTDPVGEREAGGAGRLAACQAVVRGPARVPPCGPGTTSGSGAPAGRARTGAPSWRGTRSDPPRDGRGGPRTVRSALVTATTLATRAERGPLAAILRPARAQRVPGGGTRPPDGRRVFRARDRPGPWHRQAPARRPPGAPPRALPCRRRRPAPWASFAGPPGAAGGRPPGRSRRAVSTGHLRRACRTSAVSRRRPRGLPGRRRSVAGVPPTEPLPRIGVVTQAP